MSDRHNVAVFWDYENCSPPSTSCGLGYDIVNNIRRIARLFGSVTLFRAYLDISAQSPKSLVLRSELQSSGVSIIDCPHNGRKDVVDKMILVDMLAFAVDHPTPATIILITGDRDYAYAVSILKLRRYQVILFVPSVPHASSSLESQASLVIDWNVAILRSRTEASSSAQAVRHPYLDLDANLVARLLRELHQLSLDDTDTATRPYPAATQTASRLRHISAFDLLGHSTSTASIDSTQEFALSPPLLRKSMSTACCDAAPGGWPIPKTPSRSRHASISTGSTRACSTTIATQSLPALEHEIASRNPSNARGITNVASPTKHSLSILPSLDALELPFHDNRPPSSIVVRSPFEASQSMGGIPENHGLTCSASPPIVATEPTGFETIPNSGIVAQSKTLAETITTKAQKVPKDTEHMTGLFAEENDGCSEPSTPHRAHPGGGAPEQLSSTAKLNCHPHPYVAPSTMYSPSKNAGLHLTDIPSGKRASPNMFLGVSDGVGAAQFATSPPASNILDHSAPDPLSVFSRRPVPATPFIAAGPHGCDEIVRRHSQWIIFKPLIYLLLAARERGATRPSRSTIAMDLVQSDKQVYQRAGVSKFRDYTALAEQAGVIELGGREADAWIALHPGFFEADDIPSARSLSSRVSSPASGPSQNASLTDCKTPPMESAASFQPLTPFSPKPTAPLEYGNAILTPPTDRQSSAFQPAIPTKFRPLIDTLIRARAEGSNQTLRSLVGQSLTQDVYTQAGVSGFREYVHQASEAQLVQCGGVGGHAWIRLHPELRV